MNKYLIYLLKCALSVNLLCLLFSFQILSAQNKNSRESLMVGVSEVDITPVSSMRLAGYALRTKQESEGMLMPLRAKALAFGSNYENTSVLITADLIGITSEITDKVKQKLQNVVKAESVTLSVSHTHSGPEIGSLLNILYYTSSSTPFSDTLLPANQLKKINLYKDFLIERLANVAISALEKRSPSLVYYGTGTTDFAVNRRGMPRLTDHDLPLMKITDMKGKLKAILLSYACHAVCLDSKINQYHGDWVGDAQLEIEKRHPGVLALIAVGCAGDQNPRQDSTITMLQLSKVYGGMIANAVDQTINKKLIALTELPQIEYKKIDLPFKHIPDAKELAEWTKGNTVKAFYARLALDKLARGERLPQSVPYTIQVWNFKDKLSMIFLAGEVVVEYALRLKEEIKNKNIWVIAYSNDVPCYIGSKRILNTNIYEAEASMYYYNKPSKLDDSIEDQIINTVHSLVK